MEKSKYYVSMSLNDGSSKMTKRVRFWHIDRVVYNIANTRGGYTVNLINNRINWIWLEKDNWKRYRNSNDPLVS